MSAASDAVTFYDAHAQRLRAAWADIPARAQLSPIMDHLPDAGARALDVGAGIGTLAAWLTEQGHDVVAAEPVEAFHGARGVAWTTARLPELAGINGFFDLILVSGVWQHIAPDERAASVARITHLLEDQGRLIIGLRHGPVPDGRPIWDNPTEDVILRAKADGLHLDARIEADAIQSGNRAAGVTFTWLVFGKSG